MRISRFAVRDFLSLKDSGEVVVDHSVTMLLGKNESGKSNILLALRSFDPEWDYEESELCRYSETRDKLQRGELLPADVPLVTLRFEIDGNDRRQLAKIDPTLRGAKTLMATKHFDNHYTVEIDGKLIGEAKAPSQPRETLKAIDEWLAILEPKFAEHGQRNAPFAESLPSFSEAVSQFRNLLADGDLQQGFTTFRAQLAALPNQDEPIQEDIAAADGELDGFFKRMVAEQEEAEESPNVLAEVMKLLPRFVYFEDVDRLEDRITIQEFLSDRDKCKTLANLVDLTGLDVERLQSQDLYQRSEATERASTQITGLVNDSWTQERVTVEINADGTDIFVIVKDEKGGYDPPSGRSQGFQWYLGFYINFNAGSHGELQNTVLLLDDPGIHLHPSGQRDLLNTIERLSKDNQFIFATHSPFLIDRQRLDRIRIVDKQGQRRGTTLREKWYESKDDAFEPIRAALGMTLGDSLTVSGENVVVEGPADLFILSGMARLCARLGKPSLNLDEVGIFPVDGAPKVPYWTAVLFKERLPVAAVLDHDTAGRREAKRMVEVLGIDQRLVMTLEGFKAGAECTDVELEDLIEAQFYHSAFELAYTEVFKAKGEKLPSLSGLPESACSRIKPYQDYFKRRKLGSFDKMAVARAVQNLCADLKTDEAAAGASSIENFSRLFERIRGMLDTKL